MCMYVSLDYVCESIKTELCALTKADRELYCLQKQLPRKMKSRLVIEECAGYIFWQIFLRRLQYATTNYSKLAGLLQKGLASVIL